MKKIKYLAVAFLAVSMAACGGKDSNKSSEADSTPADTANQETPAATEEAGPQAPESPQEVIEARNIDVNFDADAVEGNLSQNILIVSEGGTPSVHLEGTPDESGSMGNIKASVKLNVSKSADFMGFSSKLPLGLNLYNAEGTSIFEIPLNQESVAKVENALTNATNSEVVEVVYELPVEVEVYNIVFNDSQTAKITNANGLIPEVEPEENQMNSGEMVDWFDSSKGDVNKYHTLYTKKEGNDGSYWVVYGNSNNQYPGMGNSVYIKILPNSSNEYNGHDVSGYKYFFDATGHDKKVTRYFLNLKK